MIKRHVALAYELYGPCNCCYVDNVWRSRMADNDRQNKKRDLTYRNRLSRWCMEILRRIEP